MAQLKPRNSRLRTSNKVKKLKVTYTVELATIAAIEELACEWGVPKAEVVRRAVQTARENQLLATKARLTPLEALREMQRRPSLSRAEGNKRLAQARQIRRDWRP